MIQSAASRTLFKVLLLCPLVLPLVALSATDADEKVFVKESHEQRGILLIEAMANREKIEFSCFTSQSTCKAPERGTYRKSRLKNGEGIYQDCTNVALYKKASNGHQEAPISIYCSLQDRK